MRLHLSSDSAPGANPVPLPLFRTQVAEIRAGVDRRLAALLPRTQLGQDPLRLAIQSALLAPGKRIRPLATIFAAQDLGCRSPAVLDAGCALEMVHAASLLLDDLPCMDDAKLRRGLPATHVQFGENIAVLASVAVLSHAFAVVAAAPDTGSDIRARMVGILSGSVGTAGLVGGQFYDLHNVSNAGSLQDAISTNHLKTGALFSAGMDIACLLAGAPDTSIRALHSFARELGQAFQLLDDFRDGSSTAGELGKDVGQDRGKLTVQNLLGHERARQRFEEHLAAMSDALAPVDGGTGMLRQFVCSIFYGE